MTYGRKGRLKKENEATKETSDAHVERQKSSAAKLGAFASRARGLRGHSCLPATGSSISTFSPPPLYSKVAAADFLHSKQGSRCGKMESCLISVFKGARKRGSSM